MSNPKNIRLPYTPGINPPYLPGTPAVGFSESSITSQSGSVNANGRTGLIAVGDTPVPIISDAIAGRMVIQLLGGAPIWIGFSNTVTIGTGFRLVIDDPLILQPIIPTWGISITSPDIPDSFVQMTLTEGAI